MAHIEKTISEETIFTGRVFTVKTKQVILENGKEQQREVVLHNGGASVLPVDDEGNVYLIRQFRSPFEQEVLEILQASWKRVKTLSKLQNVNSAKKQVLLQSTISTLGICGLQWAIAAKRFISTLQQVLYRAKHISTKTSL